MIKQLNDEELNRFRKVYGINCVNVLIEEKGLKCFIVVDGALRIRVQDKQKLKKVLGEK